MNAGEKGPERGPSSEPRRSASPVNNPNPASSRVSSDRHLFNSRYQLANKVERLS